MYRYCARCRHGQCRAVSPLAQNGPPVFFRVKSTRHCFATRGFVASFSNISASLLRSPFPMASPPRGLEAHRASIDISRGASLPALERAGMRKRFMVAVDGSTSSLQALMHAAELAKEGDEITIVTVSSKARPALLHLAAAHAAPVRAGHQDGVPLRRGSARAGGAGASGELSRPPPEVPHLHPRQRQRGEGARRLCEARAYGAVALCERAACYLH